MAAAMLAQVGDRAALLALAGSVKHVGVGHGLLGAAGGTVELLVDLNVNPTTSDLPHHQEILVGRGSVEDLLDPLSYFVERLDLHRRDAFY
jgi:hypothetical protein